MLTARNEFETIEAFTSIAGSSIGNQSDRETTAELLRAIDTCTQCDTHNLWRDLAECSDEDTEVMFDIQRVAAEILTDNAPLPDFCTVDLTDGEWRVLPYLDDELPRFEETPETNEGDHVLVVNDHGNVTCMEWHSIDREYKTVWAMV